jgi:DNA-binding HxlR family transcriptional regulator
LLAALGHRDRLRIVELLFDGPLREEDLRSKVGIRNASTVSRHLDRLDAERIVGQDEQRSERRLTLPDELRAFVQSAADLSQTLSQAQADADRNYARQLRKDQFAKGLRRTDRRR